MTHFVSITIMEIPTKYIYPVIRVLERFNLNVYYTSEFCGLKNKIAFVLSLYLQDLEICLNRKCVYLISFFIF